MIIFKIEQKMFRKIFSYFHILIIFLLAFTTSSAIAELKLESVYPNQGVLGQDLTVTLKGTDFDENTRVSMTLDVGNKKTIIGSVDTPSKAYGVTVIGDTAYVTDYESGLQVIDISSPANPQIIGSVDTPSYAYDVTVVDNIAYVADQLSGLQVIDISNPTSPKIIGSVDTPDYALDSMVEGNTVYVADGDSGLQVIDVSNPTNPKIIGSVDTPDFAHGITVIGDTAYVADQLSGLQIIDISNPTSPHIIGSVDTPGIAHSVTVVGDTAYVADQSGGLQVIDISNPYSPKIIGSVDTPSYCWGVFVVGNIAYSTSSLKGLQIIDISNPTSPKIIGSVDTPGAAWSVATVDNIAYVTDWWSGLQIIDISSPASPQIIGSVDTPSNAYGITVIDDTAYVANWYAGLQVIDISNPYSPKIIGSVDTQNAAWSVSVVGDTAYVADRYAGLQVIDISNPANPEITGFVDTPGDVVGVAVVGDIAYLADGDSGLQIIDISNPTSPKIIGSVDTPDYANGITVIGDTAYVADYESGLQVIDISSPTNPQIIGSVDTPDEAWSVTVVGDTAYVADLSSGLQVIDISNPANPKIIVSVETPGYAIGVTVIGNTAFVEAYDNGLQVIDISNPYSPKIIGSVDTPGNIYSSTVIGDIAYVADDGNGLVIVPLPVEIVPFTTNNETGIYLTLPSPDMGGNYTLRVFNNKDSFELAGAVNFSTIDLANIDPNRLVIQTLEGKPTPDILNQDQDIYLQLIYIDPDGTPFNLSNLDNVNVEWMSSNPDALSINPLGHLVAKGTGQAMITAQITSGRKSVNIDVPGEFAPKDCGNLIIISGRKYQEETLEEYFTSMGNSVYEIFHNRGFDHDDIYYFSPYGQQNLTEKTTDIVDRVVGFSESDISTEIIESITTWAAQKENSGPLYIYLVDHGTPGQPIMPVTPKSPVNAAQLDAALDIFEQATSRKAYIVIEACYSGKWLNALKNKNRVVIASTGAFHAENLPTDNLISFSHYFFNDLAKGRSFGSAFNYAKDKTKDISWAKDQTPQFISSMDISSSYLVGNFATVGTLPLFVSYTGKDEPVVVQKDNLVSLEASLNMPYAQGFEVWASITPPVSEDLVLGETPYVVPDIVKLEYTGLSNSEAYFGGDKLYSGQSEVFDTLGVYDLVYFAKNITNQIIHSDHVALFVQQGDTPIADYTFEIKAQGLESLPFELEKDEQLELTLEALGWDKSINIHWFSSNPAVVSVDTNGLITAKAAGKAKITAICPGGSLSHYFIVTGVQETKSVGNLILIGGISDKETNPNSNGSLYYCFKTMAKQIYKTFHNRGFTHEDIYYFSPYGKDTLAGDTVNIVDREFTIDESGISDEILNKITTWAANQDNTGPLYIYLTGHGEPEKLIVNSLNKLLASDLDIALDTFQVNGRSAVVIVESCKSGTWVEPLKNEKRLIITSTNDKVEGLKYGWNSFSYFLANELSKGNTFETAFNNASNTITNWVKTQDKYDQAPQSFKGASFTWATPLVGNFASASASFFKTHTGKDKTFQVQTNSTLSLEVSVDVMNTKDIEVFAVLTPPVPGIPDDLSDSETPILETIRVNLALEPNTGEDKIYSAASPALITPGSYRLTFCLKDSLGELHTADPVLFTVETFQDQVALALNQGWNLLSCNIAFSVTEKLSDDTKFASAWKWKEGGWAVYLPGGDTKTYADLKSFSVLSTINPGEGFWVNSVGSETLFIEGTPVTGSLTLTSGWNLSGIKGDKTESMNDLISGNTDKITSIWKWDNGKWAVNLPGQDDDGTEYAGSKGFSVLTDINPGEGFWVNCTEDITLD